MSRDNTEDVENFVVFDTDVGTDDAWALLMLLRAEEKLQNVKILAITCVHGNTKIQHVVRNVFRILDTTKREDIPVFKGVSSSILKQTTVTEFFHGEDGFGDIYQHDQDDQINDRLQKQHAVTAMYEIATKSAPGHGRYNFPPIARATDCEWANQRRMRFLFLNFLWGHRKRRGISKYLLSIEKFDWYILIAATYFSLDFHKEIQSLLQILYGKANIVQVIVYRRKVESLYTYMRILTYMQNNTIHICKTLNCTIHGNF